MNTWRTNGSDALAVSPSEELSVGTLRAPRYTWPSACTTRANTSSILRRCVALRGMKMLPAAYMAGLGQVDARVFLGHLLEEGVRHLHEHAGAVAGVDLAAAGAAMIEVLEDLDALLDDGVRFASLDVHDEADATGVMLELRVIEALLRGGPKSNRGHFSVLQTQTRGAQLPRAMGSAPITFTLSIGYIWRRGPRRRCRQSDIYESDHTDRRSSVNHCV